MIKGAAFWPLPVYLRKICLCIKLSGSADKQETETMKTYLTE